MADHASLRSSSTSESADYKMEDSATGTDLFQGPSCPSTGADFVYSRDYSSIPLATSRSSDPDVESQLSESIFSRADSVSSFGSNSADSDTSSPPNLPVTLYSTPTEPSLAATEPSYIEVDAPRMCTNLPTLHQLKFSAPFPIRIPSMDSKRTARDPSPCSGQGSPVHSSATKFAKRHQTFPLGRTLSFDTPTVLAIRRSSTPSGARFGQEYTCLAPEKLLNETSADGSEVREYSVKSMEENLSFVGGCINYTDAKVEDELPKDAPFSTAQLETPSLPNVEDISNDHLPHVLRINERPSPLGTRQERLSASSRAETVKEW